MTNERVETKRERSVKCAGEKDSSKVKGNRERESRQRAKQCKRTAVCTEHKEVKRERETGCRNDKGEENLEKEESSVPQGCRPLS